MNIVTNVIDNVMHTIPPASYARSNPPPVVSAITVSQTHTHDATSSHPQSESATQSLCESHQDSDSPTSATRITSGTLPAIHANVSCNNDAATVSLLIAEIDSPPPTAHQVGPNSATTTAPVPQPNYIDNDIELLPSSLLEPLQELKKKKTRAAGAYKSLRNMDRTDMRPIDEFFSPKRKATSPATSPSSDAITKMSKTDHDGDTCSSPLLSDAGKHVIESECGDNAVS